MTPDEKCPIEDGTYDALLCSAGMFPGSIVPQAFKELIRLEKIHFCVFCSELERRPGKSNKLSEEVADLFCLMQRKFFFVLL